jgi:hypothetical protein
MRVMKERAGRNTEAISASVAVKLVSRRDARNALRLAARTFHAMRPAKLFEVLTAPILVAESLEQLRQVHGGS